MRNNKYLSLIHISQRVFVVHGEDTVTEEFAKTVEEKFGYQAYAPFPCSEADLLTNEILSEGVKIPVKAKKPAQRKADAAFERLVAAGRRLLDVKMCIRDRY